MMIIVIIIICFVVVAFIYWGDNYFRANTTFYNFVITFKGVVYTTHVIYIYNLTIFSVVFFLVVVIFIYFF